MVAACWRVVRFFARESCGKCTPCREGTTWLERILKRILDGDGRPEDLDLLMDVSDNDQPRASPGRRARRRSARSARRPCARSPRPSRRFRDEFEHYIEHGRPIDGVDAATRSTDTAR